MLLDAVSGIQFLSQVPFYPPLPEGPNSGAEIIYGMGIAGLWLLGLVLILVALTVILPKLFSVPKRPRHT